MPNHYHFLLRQNSDILISKFIGVLFNAYVQAVNSQQGRTGSLFEGRFKCIHVDQEPYLLQLCRYIHANPVNGGLVPNPDDWPYSNYLEWLGTRQGTLVDQVFVENYFPDRTKYQEFMLEYLQGIDELPGKLDGYLLDGLA